MLKSNKGMHPTANSVTLIEKLAVITLNACLAAAAGFEKVQTLKREMTADRTSRLVKLGFAPEEAGALSNLHTRSFM